MAHFNMWRHLVFHLKLRFAYEALFQNRSQFILQTKQNLILQFLSKIKFQQLLTKKKMQTLFNYKIYLTLWDAHMYVFLFLISIFFCLHLENARKGIPAGKSPIDHLPSNIKPDCCCIHQSSAEGRGWKSGGTQKQLKEFWKVKKNIASLAAKIWGEGHLTHPLVPWLHRVGGSR